MTTTTATAKAFKNTSIVRDVIEFEDAEGNGYRFVRDGIVHRAYRRVPGAFGGSYAFAQAVQIDGRVTTRKLLKALAA